MRLNKRVNSGELCCKIVLDSQSAVEVQSGAGFELMDHKMGLISGLNNFSKDFS